MSAATSRARRCAVATLFATAAGCFQSSAPPGWLPAPVDAQRQAFGSWISIRTRRDTLPLAEGELIAVNGDTIHVLTDGRLVSVARATICCAVLAAYRMDLAELQAWSVVGTLATASHGVLLVLTAPMWIIAGTSATSTASYAPRIVSIDPVVLRPFARFPQGIPPELDRSTLRSKTLDRRSGRPQ